LKNETTRLRHTVILRQSVIHVSDVSAETSGSSRALTADDPPYWLYIQDLGQSSVNIILRNTNLSLYLWMGAPDLSVLFVSHLSVTLAHEACMRSTKNLGQGRSTPRK
jgi:hypothetical protein